MPGRRSSKYKPQQTALWEGEVMIILAESQEALDIDEIKQRSINLTGVTPQKMARILAHLIEMGNVVKAKSKSKNRMVYKSLAVMRDQGYDVQRQEVKRMPFFKLYTGLGGGFGGAQYNGTYEFTDAKEAMEEAERMAREEYESYEGCHGIMSWSDCARALLQDAGYDEGELEEVGDIAAFAEGAGIDTEDINDMYEQEIESWITYNIKPADSLEDGEDEEE